MPPTSATVPLTALCTEVMVSMSPSGSVSLASKVAGTMVRAVSSAVVSASPVALVLLSSCGFGGVLVRVGSAGGGISCPPSVGAVPDGLLGKSKVVVGTVSTIRTKSTKLLPPPPSPPVKPAAAASSASNALKSVWSPAPTV